jgi:hypothetical protein
MIIKVVKFQKYPEEIPTGYAVGFDVSFENGRSKYIDTIVPLDLTEEQAVEAAWQNLKVSIESFKDSIGSLPSIIGTVFNPPVEEEVVEAQE